MHWRIIVFIVTFELQGKPETRTEIIQSLQGIAEKITRLEGCLNTGIYQSINDENIFFFIEEWQKQRNLDDHLKSSLFAALLGIKGLLVKAPKIKFMSES